MPPLQFTPVPNQNNNPFPGIGSPNMKFKTTTPATSTPQYSPAIMGTKAKSPQDTFIAPKNILPTNQRSKVVSGVSQATSSSGQNTNYSGSTGIPNSGSTSYSSGYSNSAPAPAYGGGLYGQLIQEARDARSKSQQFDQSLDQAINKRAGRGVPLPFVQGQQAALQRDYGVQQKAYASQAQNASDVAGLAAPVQISPGSTLTDPVTGQQVAGGLGGYANYQTAQQVFSQASNYKDAVDQNGSPFVYDQNRSPQDNWVIFSTNYLPNSRTYQASLNSSGLTSNIGQSNNGSPLAEATINQTNAGGYQDTYKQYQDLNTQYQGARNLGGLLTNTMQQYGINPSDPKIFNLTANEINNQLSSRGYARFLSTLSNVQSAYSNILASGGGTIPTAATNALHTIIDPNASFGAIQGAIDQLNQEVVSGKLVPLSNQVNQYRSNLPGSQSGNQGQSQGGAISWDSL